MDVTQNLCVPNAETDVEEDYGGLGVCYFCCEEDDYDEESNCDQEGFDCDKAQDATMVDTSGDKDISPITCSSEPVISVRDDTPSSPSSSETLSYNTFESREESPSDEAHPSRAGMEICHLCSNQTFVFF